MFAKTPAQPVPAPAAGDDVMIHVMPREFYGKEALVHEAAVPKAEPIAKPVAPPAPAPVAPPVAPNVVAPASLPAVPMARSRSWVGVLVVVVVFFAILGVGGYFAYVRISDAQEQQRLAEEAAAQAERERQALEEERVRQQREQEAAAQAAALVPVPGKDTDSDGLTDIEELLYGTDQRDPDSDKDTYLDGNEVFHRYHPLGDAPATLIDTGAVRALEEPTYPYTLYYPSTWSVALNRDAFGVTFKSARQASITVHWHEKSESQTLAQWLTREDEAANMDNMKETLTKIGYYGLVSEDDRTAYLDVGEAVVVMAYDLGEKNQIEYLQTFQMMVNSLEYHAAP